MQLERLGEARGLCGMGEAEEGQYSMHICTNVPEADRRLISQAAHIILAKEVCFE